MMACDVSPVAMFGTWDSVFCNRDGLFGIWDGIIGVRCSTLSTANPPIRANPAHFILCRDWQICAGLAD